MHRPESIIITGGGTGGHVYPALALIQTLQEKLPEVKIHYIGALSGIEKNVCEKAGIEYDGISCMKIKRRISIENLLVIPTLIKGIIQASLLIDKHNPDMVIGMGGYVTAPVMIAAILKRKRCILHEQNSIPGLTNRLLAKRVDRIISTYPSAHTALSNLKTFPAGIPLRREAFANNYPADYAQLGLRPDIFTILIFGGSGGAKRLNEITVEAFRLLKENPEIQGVLLTGTRDYEYIMSMNPPENLKCMEKLEEMGKAYRISNLVIARGGAVTIAEITANKLPSILIPFPFATGDHQRFNILPLLEKGGCEMELENELTSEKLAAMITELKNNPLKLKNIAKAAGEWGRPDANENILGVLME
jgi:UDP-N-acetylglucosamine--N-acetylmuramyl-(pentapeptide) pyrophosphoryl-undecaprenol N-acetylglucosamine transferase